MKSYDVPWLAAARHRRRPDRRTCLLVGQSHRQSSDVHQSANIQPCDLKAFSQQQWSKTTFVRKSRLLVSPQGKIQDTPIMFKSSFAQEMLQETRQHKQLQDEILPKDLGGGVYKSQFAASTHGPLDNVNISVEEDHEVRRTGSKYGNIDNINGDQAINLNHELHTSDLGTSDFSSSELWPPSTSSSPFEYTPRYRGVVSGSRSSLHADNRDNRVNSQGSFLNLQSSMQFSYLKRVRKPEKNCSGCLIWLEIEHYVIGLAG